MVSEILNASMPFC